MSLSSDLHQTGYHRANRVGVLLGLMTLCQYGVPAVIFWVLRVLFDVDTAARSFGLSSGPYLCIYLLTYSLMMGVPLWLGTKLLHHHRIAMSPLNLSMDRRICVVLCGTALCMGANLLSAWIGDFGVHLGLPRPDPFTTGDGSVLTFFMDLIVFAAVPAVMEEALMRGLVLQTLRPMGNGIAVVVSATAFGLMHGSLDQVPYALLMGLILGAVFVYTDDLALVIVTHAMANALALLSGFLAQFSSSLTAIVWQGIILLLVFVLGVLAMIWLRRHPLGRARPTYDVSRAERWGILLRAPLLWATAALMVVLMIVGNLI